MTLGVAKTSKTRPFEVEKEGTEWREATDNASYHYRSEHSFTNLPDQVNSEATHILPNAIDTPLQHAFYKNQCRVGQFYKALL